MSKTKPLWISQFASVTKDWVSQPGTSVVSRKFIYLPHKCKKETRLKSYVEACSNCILFIADNPDAKLGISSPRNIPNLIFLNFLDF